MITTNIIKKGTKHELERIPTTANKLAKEILIHCAENAFIHFSEGDVWNKELMTIKEIEAVETQLVKRFEAIKKYFNQ